MIMYDFKKTNARINSQKFSFLIALTKHADKLIIAID